MLNDVHIRGRTNVTVGLANHTGSNPVLHLKSFIPEVLRFALAVYVGVNGFFYAQKNR